MWDLSVYKIDEQASVECNRSSSMRVHCWMSNSSQPNKEKAQKILKSIAVCFRSFLFNANASNSKHKSLFDVIFEAFDAENSYTGAHYILEGILRGLSQADDGSRKTILPLFRQFVSNLFELQEKEKRILQWNEVNDTFNAVFCSDNADAVPFVAADSVSGVSNPTAGTEISLVTSSSVALAAIPLALIEHNGKNGIIGEVNQLQGSGQIDHQMDTDDNESDGKGHKQIHSSTSQDIDSAVNRQDTLSTTSSDCSVPIKEVDELSASSDDVADNEDDVLRGDSNNYTVSDTVGRDTDSTVALATVFAKSQTDIVVEKLVISDSDDISSSSNSKKPFKYSWDKDGASYANRFFEYRRDNPKPKQMALRTKYEYSLTEDLDENLKRLQGKTFLNGELGILILE